MGEDVCSAPVDSTTSTGQWQVAQRQRRRAKAESVESGSTKGGEGAVSKGSPDALLGGVTRQVRDDEVVKSAGHRTSVAEAHAASRRGRASGGSTDGHRGDATEGIGEHDRFNQEVDAGNVCHAAARGSGETSKEKTAAGSVAQIVSALAMLERHAESAAGRDCAARHPATP